MDGHMVLAGLAFSVPPLDRGVHYSDSCFSFVTRTQWVYKICDDLNMSQVSGSAQ